MATAQPDERSFYLDDFTDEVMPCSPTLEGWAEWLAKPDEDWEHEIPADGAEFAGSAIHWAEDIVATRTAEGWLLSREPSDEDFVAVRYAAGFGWSPENIISPDVRFVDPAGGDFTIAARETMRDALLRFLSDEDNGADDVEYVAVGTNEDHWRFTFRAGPPAAIEAERAQ